jgi:3-hydroxy-3-methylglutaryl CoA synthase
VSESQRGREVSRVIGIVRATKKMRVRKRERERERERERIECVPPGNTYGGSVTVALTSYLTCL